MSSTDSPRPCSVPASVPGEPARAGERLREVRLAGYTLAVRSRAPDRADLPPALFVHGLGGSSDNWSLLMAQLSDVVDGEAVDLPGFGFSPPPEDGTYSLASHARAVVRLIEAGGRGPVHLFGNSMGGAVVTRVAAARPDLVRTVTLVSPALPEVPPQRTALPTALLAVPGVTRLFRRLTRDWTAERRTHELLALCYGDPTRVDPQHLAAAVAEFERRLALPYFWDVLARSARGVVDSYTLGGQHSLWRQAERVLAPTLLVYGMRDQLISLRMARRAQAAFRDARLLTLLDAGHVAMMEYPEAVARAFRELLHDLELRAKVEPVESDEAEGAPGRRPARPTGPAAEQGASRGAAARG
ncbi:alpha/beta fold hydrolase [Streptomyces buecherae]|uniref:alpha/beta fold hydrolase n=1 Tax=Streptomyces buecherae TaxID=2763006 RepID=UPI003660DAC0